MKLRAFFILMFYLWAFDLYAQLTADSGTLSQGGALLDLKTRDPTLPGDATTTKEGGGLLLPRVYLDKGDQLYFMDVVDPEYDTKAPRHTGLMVYNLSTTADGLNPGVHIWDGMHWIPIDENNTLSENAWLKSGNREIDEDTHSLGTTDEKSFSLRTNNQPWVRITSDGKVGIGTTIPAATLDVTGSMKIAETPVINEIDAQLLAIDHDGNIGTVAAAPARLMFFESPVAQQITTTADKTLFNSAEPFVVSWETSYIVTNNLMDFKIGTNSFAFRQDALCEVSGYIDYIPYSRGPDTYKQYFGDSGVALNVIIQ